MNTKDQPVDEQHNAVPDNDQERDEIDQILDDFYDGVFIEELPKAKAAIKQLIQAECNRAREEAEKQATIAQTVRISNLVASELEALRLQEERNGNE